MLFFTGVDIVVIYIKNISLKFQKNWSWFWSPQKTLNNLQPTYNWKRQSCSIYRVHGIQNNRLDLSVSTQKSLSKKMHRVPRYCTKWPKTAGLVWTLDFWHILLNISGPSAYFSKPIAALKLWAQAGCFEYHEPYKLNDFFLVISRFWRGDQNQP